MEYYICQNCGYVIADYELDELEEKNYACPKCNNDSWEKGYWVNPTTFETEEHHYHFNEKGEFMLRTKKGKRLTIIFDGKSFRLKDREYTPEDVHYLRLDDSIKDLINLLEQGFEVELR